eukprot:TRINITY_DN3791_c0_g1_i6.p1 TRINITY_DN3791_c0_g1~~TRINITY_DN3791_c0_g1_i6.p1  ORF type:complete len:347 (-),score=18.88 TRINITY_DN3791_c0_g1_i6:526-1497(-)
MIFVFKQSKIVPACFQALQLRNLQYYSPLIQLYQSEQQPTTREESRYVRDDGYKFQFREIQSFESLYKVLQQSGSRLSGEDRAAALTRIRQIADQQGIQPPHVLLDKIQQLLVERLDGDGVSPKALASIFHGLTKLELHHDSKLFEQVLQLVQERHVLEQLDSVRLLNVLQVAKQINTANTLFLSNIAAELCYKHVNHIDSQGIAQVFIAFGKLRKELRFFSQGIFYPGQLYITNDYGLTSNKKPFGAGYEVWKVSQRQSSPRVGGLLCGLQCFEGQYQGVSKSSRTGRSGSFPLSSLNQLICTQTNGQGCYGRTCGQVFSLT